MVWMPVRQPHVVRVKNVLELRVWNLERSRPAPEIRLAGDPGIGREHGATVVDDGYCGIPDSFKSGHHVPFLCSCFALKDLLGKRLHGRSHMDAIILPAP